MHCEQWAAIVLGPSLNRTRVPNHDRTKPMNFKYRALRLMLIPVRLTGRGVRSHYGRQLSLLWRWLFKSREHTNFTYDLTRLNRRYLARFLSMVCDKPPEKMEEYLLEVINDEQLRNHIIQMTKTSARCYLSDEEARYARRIGWYAIVRAIKPRVVVETGVDKGLGTVCLAAAIMRNSAEGHPGYVYGTDINPKAGYLLSMPYNRFGQLLIGDSIESLKALDVNVDLFISDSDHSVDYEMLEFETIAPKLSANAIILGDNSHFSDKLINFAEKTNRNFLFFQESPQDHWYPGAGIGAAYSRQQTA